MAQAGQEKIQTQFVENTRERKAFQWSRMFRTADQRKVKKSMQTKL